MGPPHSRRSVDAQLPLKSAVFHILLALAESDRHGYGAMQAVAERSGGRVRLKTGQFYRHLGKLLEGGLVEESSERPPDDDPRRGAYYRLTSFGRSVLRAESERLAELVSASAALGLLRGRSS